MSVTSSHTTRGSTSQGPGHLGMKLLKELRRHGSCSQESVWNCTATFCLRHWQPVSLSVVLIYAPTSSISEFRSSTPYQHGRDSFVVLFFTSLGHKGSERGWPGHTGLFIVTSIKSNILKDDGNPRWNALWKHLSGLKYLKPGAGLSGSHSLSWDVLSGFLGGLPNIWMKSHLCAAVRTEGARTQAPLGRADPPSDPGSSMTTYCGDCVIASRGWLIAVRSPQADSRSSSRFFLHFF